MLAAIMLKNALFSAISTAIFTVLAIIALRVLCTEQYMKSGIITLHVRALRYAAPTEAEDTLKRARLRMLT